MGIKKRFVFVITISLTKLENNLQNISQYLN